MKGKLKDSEIQNLLKNMVDVLKVYTVSELNQYLVSALNKKEDTYYAQEYILDLVCETYNISRKQLIYSKSNQSVTKPRQIAFCLLHFTLHLSTRHIANKIFHFKFHNTVGSAIRMYKKLDVNIKPDREFKESMQVLEKKVMSKLKELEKNK